MGSSRIIWTKQAKESLKQIYLYYKDKSPQGARNVRDDLLQAPRTIRYAKQYQLDRINPDYRRIVVRDYKILYRQEEDVVRIIDIVSTHRSPEHLKGL